jgi:hypothetical protein
VRALVVKEFRSSWGSIVAAALVAAFLLVALGEGVLSYGLPESGLGGGSWAFLCLVTGAAVGYRQWHDERAKQTEVYLRHRASGAVGAHRAKVLVGLALLSLLLAIELGLHAAWIAISSDDAHPVRWERVRDHLAVATLLASGYGVGSLTSVLPRHRRLRFGLLLIGSWTVITLALAQMAWVEWSSPRTAFAMFQLALAAVLIGLSGAVVRSASEPERPMRGRVGVWLAPASLVLFALPFAFGPTWGQAQLLARLSDGRERIVRLADGTIAVVPDGSEGELVPSHRAPWDPPVEAWTIYQPRRTPMQSFTHSKTPPEIGERRAAFAFDGPFVRLRGFATDRQMAWFDLTERTVLALHTDAVRRTSVRRLGRGPSWEPFSRETVVLYPQAGSGRDAVLVDRVDASAWRLVDDEGGPRLAPAPLPSGDVLIGVERLHGLGAVRTGRLEPLGEARVARGACGLWRWDGAAWKPFVATVAEVLEPDVPQAVLHRVERAGADVLWHEVAVVDAQSGERLLVHRYGPRDARDARIGAFVQGLSLLRPPIAAVAAWSSPAERWDVADGPLDPLVLDPALVGRQRTWLLLAGIGVAALLAWLATRRLGRAEDRVLRRVWFALVLVFGVPAFLASVLVEPRRAARVRRAPREIGEALPLVAGRA